LRVAIVSDAWRPQINGVVRTIETVAQLLRADGHDVEVFGPDRFRTLPCPTYPEIRLSLFPSARLSHMLKLFAPDAIHLVTEGPLGWAARAFCRRRGIAFTTAYHTRFPEYLHARFRLPLSWSYAWLRRFHGASRGVMAPTQVVVDDLVANGFQNVKLWSRGVDADIFHPQPSQRLNSAPPIFLYVGRVAVEKNVEAFLELDLPGSKWVVGTGPAIDGVRARFPEVNYLGLLDREELAKVYAAADVFVFPSRTDTFGLVLLSGLPVAAFPVAGPRDVIGTAPVGVLNEDLRTACLEALQISPETCVEFAAAHSWQASARVFVEHALNVRSVKPEGEVAEFVAEGPHFAA